MTTQTSAIPFDGALESFTRTTQLRLVAPLTEDDHTDPTPTIGLDIWVDGVAKRLGWNLRELSQATPDPSADQHWREYCLRHGIDSAEASEEMFAAWADVAAEEASAYDQTVTDHWPAESWPVD
jgi:hypothetical protein